MKLVGKLREDVSNVHSKEEAHDLIKKAGMLLNEDELDSVTGGGLFNKVKKEEEVPRDTCDNCLYGWTQCKAYGGQPVNCPENPGKKIQPKAPACSRWKPRPF